MTNVPTSCPPTEEVKIAGNTPLFVWRVLQAAGHDLITLLTSRLRRKRVTEQGREGGGAYKGRLPTRRRRAERETQRDAAVQQVL